MNFKKRLTLFNCLSLSVVMFLVLQPLVAAPTRVSIFEGEEYSCELFGPYTTKTEVSENANDYEIPVRLFGVYEVKTVSVSVSDTKYLIPGGQAVGMKMHSEGPVVVGFEKIRTKDGEYDAQTESGVCSGDRIIKVDDKPCTKTNDLANVVSKKGNRPVKLTVIRNGTQTEIFVTPRFCEETGTLRLGLWLRDSSAGIGTVTFIDPDSGRFGALGHGICDQDTAQLVVVSDGKIVSADVFDVKKGLKGVPGELRGAILSGDRDIGTIEKNTNQGVFGTLSDFDASEKLPVASKTQVKKGKAYIRSCVGGKEVKDYEIRITRTGAEAFGGFRGMEIEVTDEELIDKTGGIVQGMSGSPIIQDGKIIGAVTHVFVNDPLKGYGIYITDMLEACGN